MQRPPLSPNSRHLHKIEKQSPLSPPVRCPPATAPVKSGRSIRRSAPKINLGSTGTRHHIIEQSHHIRAQKLRHRDQSGSGQDRQTQSQDFRSRRAIWRRTGFQPVLKRARCQFYITQAKVLGWSCSQATTSVSKSETYCVSLKIQSILQIQGSPDRS